MPVLDTVRDEDLSQSSVEEKDESQERKQQCFVAWQVVGTVPLERRFNSKFGFV
jgi:hypothetical protein